MITAHITAPTPPTRSLACVELIGFLEASDDVLVELVVAFDDDGQHVEMHHALHVPRACALAELAERCPLIERHARAACCLVDVPFLEASVLVDGERVSFARFPEAAARVIAPHYDALLRAMKHPPRDPFSEPTVSHAAH